MHHFNCYFVFIRVFLTTKSTKSFSQRAWLHILLFCVDLFEGKANCYASEVHC